MTADTTDSDHKRYIFFLAAILMAVWLLYDFILVKESPFAKGEEYSFEDKLESVIKDKVNSELQRYEASLDKDQQVIALVHALECNYFLVYNSFRRLERYYDFIKIVLFPHQRRQLKDKKNYLRQIRRYLKRKRNVNVHFSKYEVSLPRFSGPTGEETAQLTVIRTIVTGLGKGTTPDAEITKEVHTYSFKRHTDRRFYLYFTDKGILDGTPGYLPSMEAQ